MNRVSVLFLKKKIVGYISSSKISPILQFEGLKRFVLVKILQNTKIAHNGVKQLLKLVNRVFIKLLSWTFRIFTSKLLSGTPEKSRKKCFTSGMEWSALSVKAKCSLPRSACQFCSGIMKSSSKQIKTNSTTYCWFGTTNSKCSHSSRGWTYKLVCVSFFPDFLKNWGHICDSFSWNPR